MAKKTANTLVCLRCKLEIFGVELKHVVRLSHGPMHATCHKQHQAQIQQMFDAAIAAGTHSRRVVTFCDLCRNFVEGGVFHLTLDHKRVCIVCAQKMGITIPSERKAS